MTATLSTLINSLPPIEPSPPKVDHRLTGEVSLPLHTKRAQALCQGSWKSYQDMGLFQFVSVLAAIERAAEMDDPYADLYKEKLEQKILAITQAIKSTIHYYEKALQEWRGRLEVKILSSQQPLKLPLQFSSPLGYVTAFTIGELDYLARQALTFRRLGIFPEVFKIEMNFFNELKGVFIYSRGWRHTGVTRQDMQEKNQKAERAKMLMGFMPSRILKHKKEASSKKKQ